MTCFCHRILLNCHSWQIFTCKHPPIKHLLVRAQLAFYRTVFSAWSHIFLESVREGETATTTTNRNMLFHLKDSAARWPSGLLWRLFSQRKMASPVCMHVGEFVCIQKPSDLVDLQWRSTALGVLSWSFIVRTLSKRNGQKAYKSYLLPCYRLTYWNRWDGTIYSLMLEWL